MFYGTYLTISSSIEFLCRQTPRRRRVAVNTGPALLAPGAVARTAPARRKAVVTSGRHQGPSKCSGTFLLPSVVQVQALDSTISKVSLVEFRNLPRAVPIILPFAESAKFIIGFPPTDIQHLRIIRKIGQAITRSSPCILH